MKTTSVFSKNIEVYNRGDKFIVNKGSSRSSKTYSILQLFYIIAKYSEKHLILSVVSRTLPHLKSGAMRDFDSILLDAGVIPDKVKMTGTIRTIDPETRKTIPDLMERMIVETAQASGGDAEFKILAGYPPTINDDTATAFARDTLEKILGKHNLVEIPHPVMGGEDFAYFLEKIPGTFIRIGVGDSPPLHNSMYDFNDEAIPFGIRIMAGIAVQFLETGLQ